MSFFRRPDYQSDATQFINSLKEQKPELAAQQLAGRSLLWDKQVDREAWDDYDEGRVEQKPYVYQTNSWCHHARVGNERAAVCAPALIRH